MKQAVILAGGLGTRLQLQMGSRPKALADVGGTPLLGHQLALLQKYGFREVVLLVSYGADDIRKFCDAWPDKSLTLKLLDDGERRGTAGAVLNALPDLAEQFLILYGDTMLNVDLTRFWEWHRKEPATAASLFLHPNDHPQDSDLVEVDDRAHIIQFHPYPHPAEPYLQNLGNAALYVIRRDALLPFRESQQPLDFAKNLFPAMLRSGATLRGYASAEYIKDAGTPERLSRVRRDCQEGTISRSSLSVKQKAVFIDRDGTLNEQNGFVKSPEDLKVFDFAARALRRLNENGWRSVVITNQPVVARGDVTEAGLRQIHAKLETQVGKSGAYFDRIYVCPHHPDAGYPGERPDLKMVCNCRKPAPGLIRQAASEMNLDLGQSWLIGDSAADMQAAAAVGVRSILVETGPDAFDPSLRKQASYVLPDFRVAVDFIIDVYPKTEQQGAPANLHREHS